MIKLGNITLNGTPRVAVGFGDRLSPEALNDIEKYGVDVVELRIDQYSSFDQNYVLNEVKKFQKFPSIATIRTEKEGGGWNLSEDKRVELFRAILSYVDAIDIELSSRAILPNMVTEAHKLNKLVVVSYHNFDKTPNNEKLISILDESKGFGADIVKVSTLALTRDDVQVLADFTIKNNSKNLITIAMGSEGTLSRVFFPALGSLVTYAFLGKPTAPGQLDYSLTIDFLRKLYPKYNQEKIDALKLLELI